MTIVRRPLNYQGLNRAGVRGPLNNSNQIAAIYGDLRYTDFPYMLFYDNCTIINAFVVHRNLKFSFSSVLK